MHPTNKPSYVYLRDEHLTEEHVLKLAEYVVREMSSLEKLPAAAVFESRYVFVWFCQL